jgi:hypothetical protein
MVVPAPLPAPPAVMPPPDAPPDPGLPAAGVPPPLTGTIPAVELPPGVLEPVALELEGAADPPVLP